MPFQEHTRLVLPTLALSGLLLLLGCGAAWYLQRAQVESTQALEENITRVQASEELILIAAQLQLAIDQALVSGSEEALQPTVDLNRRADRWIESAHQLARSPQSHEHVERITAGYRRLRSEFKQQLDSSPGSNDVAETISHLRDVLHRQILDPAREYQQYNRERLAESTTRGKMLSDRTSLVLLLIGCSGAVVGLMAGFTVARRVQRRFTDQQRAMAHSEQLAALGRVAAAVAHELRNPLTSMQIIVQAACDEAGEIHIDAKEISILENEIQRLDNSIQTFLDYARPPHPDKHPCALQSLVNDTFTLLRRRAEQVNVRLHHQLPDDPIVVNVDEAQIKQVLLNILLNALEASPDGGVISLRAITAPDPTRPDSPPRHGNQVRIEIADTGGGLPKKLGNRIFDAFVSTKDTGTGLGLAICKRIVEDHAGSISARNAKPNGSVFTIELHRG